MNVECVGKEMNDLFLFFNKLQLRDFQLAQKIEKKEKRAQSQINWPFSFTWADIPPLTADDDGCCGCLGAFQRDSTGADLRVCAL